MSKLLEFYNNEGELLRGIFDEADSEEAVVFVHGFEGTTIRTRNKNFIDCLRGKVNLLRFDFAGLGLSDGDFSEMTVEKSVGELKSAINKLKAENAQIQKVNIIAHSLGACVALEYWKENKEVADKVILFAPALNQGELNRYFFATYLMRDKKPGLKITWSNYKDCVNEEKYKEYIEKDPKKMKEHYLCNKYHLENADKDYQPLLKGINLDRILIIHSLLDDKVPFDSNDKLPDGIKIIKLDIGDHDLQSPDVADRYLDQVINFLTDK